MLFECCLLSCWPHTNSMDHNSSCVILYVLSNCLVNCTYVWEGVQEYILHVWWNGTDQKKANRISMFSFWPVVIFFLPYLRALSRSNVRRLKIPSRCVLSLSNLNKYYFPLLLIIFVLLFLKQLLSCFAHLNFFAGVL